ncbi:MAG TPA: hypothetical protein VJG67_03880 [Candidatus Paceibacterota bacterium]
MISIEQCRKTLGERADKLTDEQLVILRNSLYSTVNLIFDHLQKKEMKKNKKYQNENIIPASI